MKNDSLKRLSIASMVILIVICVIGFILGVLFSYWNSRPEPVTYIVEGIIPNDNTIMNNCDISNVTIIKNVTTNQISYRCGYIGELNELITIYE